MSKVISCKNYFEGNCIQSSVASRYNLHTTVIQQLHPISTDLFDSCQNYVALSSGCVSLFVWSHFVILQYTSK